MTSKLKPSDINKSLAHVMLDIETKAKKKNIGPFDISLFTVSGLSVLSIFAGAVLLPTATVAAFPVLSSVGTISLVGAAVVAGCRKFKMHKDMKDTVKDFCARTNIDHERYKEHFSTSGYSDNLLRFIIQERHFDEDAIKKSSPQQLEDKVFETCQKAQKSFLSSFVNKMNKKMDEAFDVVSNKINETISETNLSNKIKNSKNAFLQGYNEIIKENEQHKSPKIK